MPTRLQPCERCLRAKKPGFGRVKSFLPLRGTFHGLVRFGKNLSSNKFPNHDHPNTLHPVILMERHRNYGIRCKKLQRLKSSEQIARAPNPVDETPSNPDLSGCTGGVAMRRTWVFASQRLPGMMRLGCRESLGLIRARRSLYLLPLSRILQ